MKTSGRAGSYAALGAVAIAIGFGAARGPEPGPADDGVVEVVISRLEFSTPTLRIPAGGTVRWVNRDVVAHTVTPDQKDADWGSASLAPGEAFHHRFESEGDYGYHCQPHPFMRARIIVVSPGPYH